MQLHPFNKERKVEPVPVVVNKNLIAGGKQKERGEDFPFLVSGVVHPLDEIPAVRLVIYASDQINGVRLGTQTGRFYVQKKKIGQRSYGLQKLFLHVYVDCLTDYSHVDLLSGGKLTSWGHFSPLFRQ